MLSSVKLIAEPWDCGPGGYQVGAFLLAGQSGTINSATRRANSGTARRTAAALTPSLCASADIFNHQGRRPWASINFVTAHDGFTLNDLVYRYNEKHNEANGEDNRDGSSNNHSWNCGVEGPNGRPGDHRAAQAQMRNTARHPAALAGNAHAAGRGRIRSHTGGQ